MPPQPYYQTSSKAGVHRSGKIVSLIAQDKAHQSQVSVFMKHIKPDLYLRV